MTILTNSDGITTRRLKGRARRTATLSTKVTPQELELISAASEADGRAQGEWVREVLLKAARSSTLDLGANHLMTEIVALQLFLTDVFSSVACGEPYASRCAVIPSHSVWRGRITKPISGARCSPARSNSRPRQDGSTTVIRYFAGTCP